MAKFTLWERSASEQPGWDVYSSATNATNAIALIGVIEWVSTSNIRPYRAWRLNHDLGVFKTPEAAAKLISEVDQAAGGGKPMSVSAFREWQRLQREARAKSAKPVKAA